MMLNAKLLPASQFHKLKTLTLVTHNRAFDCCPGMYQKPHGCQAWFEKTWKPGDFELVK